jgi:nicotinamide mononucleotide transporter
MMSWLSHQIAMLNTVLFTMGDDQVTWAELLGFLTGGACVVLTVRAHVGNFPVGILNSAFFLVLFLSARIYADASLQVVYILLGFLGWWQWLRGGPRRSASPAPESGYRNVGQCAALEGGGEGPPGSGVPSAGVGVFTLAVLLRDVLAEHAGRRTCN